MKVSLQKSFPGMDTMLHGIRLDTYIEASEEGEDVEVEPDIYDIEPNKICEKAALPKRTRYYHGLIDAKMLEAGSGYEKLQNVFIIMILPYDPFGKGRMVYTVKNCCVEDRSIPYEDGAVKIYLYTKGTQGNPSQALKEMLKYIENSVTENVTNNEIASIHEYVTEVKRDKEVGIQYMKSWEHECRIREEGREEGKVAERQRLNTLNRKLAEAGRTEDIIRAASDIAFQKKLLEEFCPENNDDKGEHS